MRASIDGFRLPIPVLVVAVLAALLHIAPYWRAQSQTPPDWTFTGNIHSSPDYLQYRVWFRQSQREGILISNTFTTETNTPHLLVIFYYAVGKISSLTGSTPEFVYAYLGSFFAFVLVILLFFAIRLFLKSLHQVWWVLSVILVGGGFGAYFKILSDLKIVRNSSALSMPFAGLESTPVFEDYRSNYVFLSLFDTHYLLIWVVSLVAVLSLYFALRKATWASVLFTALSFALTTLLHIYEGVTLIAITAGILFICWRKGMVDRVKLAIGAICSTVCLACAFAQVLLYKLSGLPLPSWRGPGIFFSILLIAYPVAWVVIAFGVTDYWRHADFNKCFLLGWMLGCVALTLSSPFCPYADRGTMTLQIPIYVIAGIIYFARSKVVTPIAAMSVILALGATPAFALYREWANTGFSSRKPYMFLSAEHREIVDVLQRATPNEVLIVDKHRNSWQTDDLWLAPDFPGKLYCGHFFLTVDYERKCAEVNHFFDAPAIEQAAFLRQQKIRYVYVEAINNPGRFGNVPGLTLIKAESIGSLFEYDATVTDANR